MAQASTADVEDINNANPESGAATPKKKGKAGLWIALLLLVLLGGGGFAAWSLLLKPAPVTSDEQSASGSTGKPYYLELNPNFVVNLDDPDLMRYLQVDLQVMAHDQKSLDQVDSYMPAIRNALLLLFAQQKYENLITRAGKEALQAAALAEINQVLKSHGASGSIEAVLFTSFVMQ